MLFQGHAFTWRRSWDCGSRRGPRRAGKRGVCGRWRPVELGRAERRACGREGCAPRASGAVVRVAGGSRAFAALQLSVRGGTAFAAWAGAGVAVWGPTARLDVGRRSFPPSLRGCLRKNPSGNAPCLGVGLSDPAEAAWAPLSGLALTAVGVSGRPGRQTSVELKPKNFPEKSVRFGGKLGTPDILVRKALTRRGGKLVTPAAWFRIFFWRS